MAKPRPQLVIVTLAALLVLAVVALVGVIQKRGSTPLTPSPEVNAPVDTNTPPIAEEPPVDTNTPPYAPAASDEKGALKISWLEYPAEVPGYSLSAYVGTAFDAAPPGSPTGMPTAITAYKVGTVTSTLLHDYPVLVMRLAEEGPGVPAVATVIADNISQRFIVVGKYSSKYAGPGMFEAGRDRFFVRNDDLTIPDLTMPARMTLTSGGYDLVPADNVTPYADFLTDFEMHKLSTTKDGRDIYGGDFSNGASDGCLYIILPNKMIGHYQYDIPFFTNKRVPEITWADGAKNKEDYTPTNVYGCGGRGCYQVKSEVQVKSETRLVKAGTTSNNEAVYTVKSVNDMEIQDRYAGWYVPDGEKKPAIDAFFKARPVFYWKDPLGRWVEWQQTQYQPMAECGKPVIYLYPQSTTDTTVRLGSNIDVTQSIPAYSSAWHVTAQPDGTLTDANGTYPYLYWEGTGAGYGPQTHGAVIAASDVDAFLTTTLAKLGLNAKESADFREFWTPRVSASPFARISFVPQPEWSVAAPLSISPTPRTMIRVFMDWQPLNAPISIEPQSFEPTPARDGFTAVEWGGTLYP
jgi:hypothetical protein